MSARVSRYLLGAGSAALALGVALATAPTALASTTIQLKTAQDNTSWTAYSHEDCPADNSAWLWHFVLPGGDATFDSLTVHFQTAGDVVKTSDWVQSGKGAYVTVSGADTVVDASATIEGSTPQGDFVISHTCEGPSGGTTGGTTGTTGTTGDTTGTTGTTGDTTGTTGTTGDTTGTTGTTGDTTGTTGTTGDTTGGGAGGGTTTTGGGGTTSTGGGGGVQGPTLGGGGVTTPTAGGGSGLPFTGQNTLQLVGWALGALAAGLVLLKVGRARRHARR